MTPLLGVRFILREEHSAPLLSSDTVMVGVFSLGTLRYARRVRGLTISSRLADVGIAYASTHAGRKPARWPIDAETVKKVTNETVTFLDLKRKVSRN